MERIEIRLVCRARNPGLRLLRPAGLETPERGEERMIEAALAKVLRRTDADPCAVLDGAFVKPP